MVTTENKTTIDMINGLSEIAEFMDDEDLTQALTMVAKLILNPGIPINVATLEIVRLQAIATKMSFKATWMANVDKGDRAKKNIYFTAASSINDLVAALKYITRFFQSGCAPLQGGFASSPPWRRSRHPALLNRLPTSCTIMQIARQDFTRSMSCRSGNTFNPSPPSDVP